MVWKDKKKGYKSVLICILKNLQLKGYYKGDIILTNEIYLRIAKNTFKVQIEINTAKKVDADYIDTSFIQYASTLP